jgi:hypothetical protein
MKRFATLVSLAVLCFGLGGIAAQTQSPNFAGTWLGRTEIPDAGIDELELVFEKIETGWKGTFTDSMGQLAKETPLSDIVVDGNTVTFRFPLVDGTMIISKLTLAGDKMTGAWEHPEGNMGTLEFERKK